MYAVSATPEDTNTAIQSVVVGLAMPLKVPVTLLPAATLAGLAVSVVTATTVTVNALLVARRVNPLAENSRSSYVVPAAAPAGIRIAHDPDATAAPTACVQLPAYAHAMYAVSAAA